jgi:hypothetical protein
MTEPKQIEQAAKSGEFDSLPFTRPGTLIAPDSSPFLQLRQPLFIHNQMLYYLVREDISLASSRLANSGALRD